MMNAASRPSPSGFVQTSEAQVISQARSSNRQQPQIARVHTNRAVVSDPVESLVAL